ncbi:Myosin light chain kinase, smooth muscle [Gossypium arboreum]|uniref:Myosin light chain kinase, smooth muscle n=1 Tax=Gossypium arboreum TaxID=29729 RepID=A0A0B0PDK4_GOSAR|nr:Myosin light chain kinase, smooth muscle [Gossypium arboreum]
MGVRTNFRDNLKAFKEKKTRLNCTQGQRKGTGRENRPLGGKGGSSAPQRLHLWPRTTRYTRCLVGVDSDVKVEWRTTRRRGAIGCGTRAVCLGFG